MRTKQKTVLAQLREEFKDLIRRVDVLLELVDEPDERKELLKLQKLVDELEAECRERLRK
jgi:hypothetical protein